MSPSHRILRAMRSLCTSAVYTVITMRMTQHLSQVDYGLTANTLVQSRRMFCLFGHFSWQRIPRLFLDARRGRGAALACGDCLPMGPAVQHTTPSARQARRGSDPD